MRMITLIQKRWRRFVSLILLLVSACIVGFFSLGISPGCSDSHRRDVRLVYHALAQYAENDRGNLPLNVYNGDEAPLVSWRFQLAPYLSAAKLPFAVVPNATWESSLYKEWRSFSEIGLCPEGSQNAQVQSFCKNGRPWWGYQSFHDMPADLMLLCWVNPRFHWMAPHDLDWEDAPESATVADFLGGDVTVACADGSVRCLRGYVRIRDIADGLFRN